MLSSPLSFNQTAALHEGRVFLVNVCPPGLALHFAQRSTNVISLMRINNRGRYLALNNITSHPCRVGVLRKLLPSFPGLIIHSWHTVSRLNQSFSCFIAEYSNCFEMEMPVFLPHCYSLYYLLSLSSAFLGITKVQVFSRVLFSHSNYSILLDYFSNVHVFIKRSTTILCTHTFSKLE